MTNLLNSILKDDVIITSYSAADGWDSRSVDSSITVKGRFIKDNGLMPGQDGKQIAFSGHVMLAGNITLNMTDTVTINSVTYNVLKVTEVKNFSNQVVRVDGVLG